MFHTRGVSSRRECEASYFAVCFTLVVSAQEENVKRVTLTCVLHVRNVSLRTCEVCYFNVCLTHSWCEIKKFVTLMCVLHTRGVRSRSLLLCCVSYTLVV